MDLGKQLDILKENQCLYTDEEFSLLIREIKREIYIEAYGEVKSHYDASQTELEEVMIIRKKLELGIDLTDNEKKRIGL